MGIIVHEAQKSFHLYNGEISYILAVLPDGSMGQLYCGKRIHDREDYSYFLEGCIRSHSAVIEDDGTGYSLEHLRQEYPVYGSSDYRLGAVEILQGSGSRLVNFVYEGYTTEAGKRMLPGLPSAVAKEADAETLRLILRDPAALLKLELLYTIFEKENVIVRSARITNEGNEAVDVTRAMSLCLDLPDAEYDWIQFSGSWGRERFPRLHRLEQGICSVGSLRGNSSHQHNPFVILKRPHTDEMQGEALGISLIYSGNFLIQAEVDTYGVTRMTAGIHPEWFTWHLGKSASFQTPEALLTFSNKGLNGLSQTLHRFYRDYLIRSSWALRPRPVLINNWEATFFDFNEEKLLRIAKKAVECGVEMFVLDDGWFGGRRSDCAGLGDWTPARELLPDGIKGLSEKIEALGMRFGLWIEPEMVNPDSDLFRSHPDWILHIPGRRASLTRHQCVLDFSRPEVVEHIYRALSGVIRESRISYIKWDMNRSITECFSAALAPERQGEVFHRYILGVYSLYERLTQAFPDILFESCAGGGGRFDAGMLCYAPQAWCSDNTDAVERMKIQYGTSYGYPVSSIGSHVSAVPNDQVGRITPLATRAAVAYFGTFGYELDLNLLTEEELEEVRSCTAFMKEYRELIQFGDFYRLVSPFEGDEMAWMTVSEDGSRALVGHYRILNHANEPFTRLRLAGLKEDSCYEVSILSGDGKNEVSYGKHFGDELMHAGLVTSTVYSGKTGPYARPSGDFTSELYLLRSIDAYE